MCVCECESLPYLGISLSINDDIITWISSPPPPSPSPSLTVKGSLGWALDVSRVIVWVDFILDIGSFFSILSSLLPFHPFHDKSSSIPSSPLLQPPPPPSNPPTACFTANRLPPVRYYPQLLLPLSFLWGNPHISDCCLFLPVIARYCPPGWILPSDNTDQRNHPPEPSHECLPLAVFAVGRWLLILDFCK